MVAGRQDDRRCREHARGKRAVAILDLTRSALHRRLERPARASAAGPGQLSRLDAGRRDRVRITAQGRSRITIPCGEAPLRTLPDVDVYGPIAFSPDGKTVYVALATDRGTVDMWAARSRAGAAGGWRRLRATVRRERGRRRLRAVQNAELSDRGRDRRC